MARRDYDHWNEDADLIWWMEEGQFGDEIPYCDICGGNHAGECPDE